MTGERKESVYRYMITNKERIVFISFITCSITYVFFLFCFVLFYFIFGTTFGLCVELDCPE